MSKNIRITDADKTLCLEQLTAALESAKLADGKFNFSYNFGADKEKATLFFTAAAWTKMVAIIQEFSDEVAWHGLAERVDSGDGKHEYRIYDILVYPQEVTGTTVETDQQQYQMWLMSTEDEVFDNMRMQGHSHVNMGVTPSGKDLEHQEKILDVLKDDMFYIFMIWNKSYSHHIKIYDLAKNILFENNDVNVKIDDAGLGISEFLKEARELVKKPVAKIYSYRLGKYTPQTTPALAPKPETPKPKSTALAEKAYGRYGYDDEGSDKYYDWLYEYRQGGDR